ncbi:DUF4345 family protein [Ruegeria atlantica]|uniref:DUF4345 domain-containing protein n=1 Tax=Ruegeria atlantica TaxID=81569 RepID=A0A0N7LN27_9RHOB|nr:DUF4345 family protein [Ruegeria atlantica]CUH41252.1 hypothetical protein RUM4293_00120 [Ruegeria atlantica]
MKYSIPLKSALFLIGLAIMTLGLNIGLGGIPTLGWQTSEPFIAVINEAVYHVQDSHIRFIGGVWFSIGAIFSLGAIMQATLRPTLIILCSAIAFAGLFRLSGIDGGAVFSAEVMPSLVLELVAFPILAWWLAKSGKPNSIVAA